MLGRLGRPSVVSGVIGVFTVGTCLIVHGQEVVHGEEAIKKQWTVRGVSERGGLRTIAWGVNA